MNWYYVDAGQQAGPVDDAQLTELVRSGKIQPDTLVWREGMTGWVSYREAVPSGGPPPQAPEVGVPPGPTAAAGGLICSECGRAFAPDQVIRHGDKWVCATCKPIFLQRLREGVTLAGPAFRGAATEADILARDYEVDIGGCLSQAWDLFKTNAGIMIGASLLVGLALFGAQVIPFGVGVLLSIIFRGPLLGGLWFFYIKKVRRQEATLGDAFSGFGPRFGQLFLTQLIPFLIVFGAALILVLLALATRGFRGSSGAFPVFIIPIIILGVAFFVVMMYLSVCWLFALPLVSDKGLKFWPALQLSRLVVSKHWWMTFLLFFVSCLLGVAGVFACCFGVLITGPVAFAALNYHYEKVFGDLMPSQTP